MTQSINQDTQGRAQRPLSDDDIAMTKRSWIVIAARIFTGVMGTAALGFLLAAFTFAGWRSALAATTFGLLAFFGVLVLAIDGLMCDRREYYQRGQLDGWYRGYRMQPPEVDQPL